MKFINRLALGILFLSSAAQKASAQCDTLALAPDSIQIVTNSTVTSMVKYGDTLYIAGGFSYIGRYTGTFTALDSATGGVSLNNSLPRINGIVRKAIPDGSGGWIVVGDFTLAGNATRKNVAHITSAYQLGPVNAAMDGVVYSAVVNNGKLYIGGSFSTVNGQTRNKLAAFDLGAGTMTTWNPNSSGNVYALTTNGKDIFAGGAFTMIGSAGRNRIAAIDTGTGIATAFNPGCDDEVLELLVKNNKIYAAGKFTMVGSVYRRYVAAIDTTTGLASPFSLTFNSGTHVQALAVSGNRLYIGGKFGSINSATRECLAAVDTATATLLPLNVNLNATYGAEEVFDIDVSGSKVFIAGNFNSVNSISHDFVAILDSMTGAPTPFSPLGYPISDVYTVQASGTNVWVGGDFPSFAGVKRSGLAGINLANNSVIGWAPNFNNSPVKLALDNGKLYLTGGFTSINGSARNKLACIDIPNGYSLTAWNPLSGQSLNKTNELKIYGNDAYLAGNFSFSSNGFYHDDIVKMDKTSGAISNWTPTGYTSNEIWGIDTMNNTLHAAGGISQTSSTMTRGIFSVNMTATGNIPVTLGNVNGTVYAIRNYNQKLYIAGIFSTVSSATKDRTAAFNTSMGLAGWDADLTSSAGSVEGLIPYKDKMIVSGQFSSAGSYYRKGIVMVDTGVNGVAPGWRPELTAQYSPVAFATGLAIGDTLFIGGAFEAVSSRKLSYLSRYHMNHGTPSVTVNGPSQICSGTSATFTITTNTTPLNYVWKKNGVTVATNTSTYTYTPVNGDQLTCSVNLNNNTCFLVGSAISAPYTVTVTNSTTATATISGTNNTCAGQQAAYTATTNIAGAGYQWKVNSANVGSNSNTYSYTPINGDVISCTVSAPANACYSPMNKNSNNITAIVVNNTTPTVGITATSNPVCAGASTTVSATTNMGTGAAYQWKVNNMNSGTNSSSFSYAPANGDVVTCEVTATSGCFSPATATSNQVTLTTTAPATPTLLIAAKSNPVICEGTLDTFMTTTNVTGGSYQWKVNGFNAGTNSSTYVYAPNNGDVVSCELSVPPSGCFTTSLIVGNAITMTVPQKLTPSISILAPATVAVGTTVNITASVSNAGSNYSIKWENNGVVFATTSTPSASYTKSSGTEMIMATITPAGCYNTATSNAVLVSEQNTAVNSIQFENIRVYPNPVANQLTLDGLKNDTRIQLFSLAGVQVYSRNSNEKSVMINTSALPAGTYLLLLTASDGATMQTTITRL